MKKKIIKRLILFTITIFLFLSVPILPGFPWSARSYQKLRRMANKLGIKVAAWRNEKPQPVSISAKLSGSGAFIQALKGAQVVALESTSGYGVMTNAEGRFTLPHLTWYPNAEYNLVIKADDNHIKRLKIIAPANYPQEGIVDVGEINFEEKEDIDNRENPARQLVYDSENNDYYSNLFERLTRDLSSNHQKIDAINKFVATRHNPKENAWSFNSAREIVERGAPHCSNLAFALAVICAAGGYPSRTIHTSDDAQYTNTHVATEVYYDDAWHLYDPTYGISFVNENGTVAGYKDLRLNPQLINAEAFKKIQPEIVSGALEWMLPAYASGLHQIYQVKKERFCIVW
jgi:hypothetical protein